MPSRKPPRVSSDSRKTLFKSFRLADAPRCQALTEHRFAVIPGGSSSRLMLFFQTCQRAHASLGLLAGLIQIRKFRLLFLIHAFKLTLVAWFAI